jgi:predicted acylesterase/phospholipase RssA
VQLGTHRSILKRWLLVAGILDTLGGTVTGTKLVNGIFKGGGTKGAVYAGALRSMAKRQLWFGSVAGTSAGAITAALIAAGLNADQLALQVPDLLKKLKRQLVRLVLGLSDSVWDNRQLGEALEAIFRAALGGTGTEPVTFADLYHASCIHLYVVAFDLQDRQPVVFSAATTPNVSVTSAVLASTAIPSAFPSGRAVRRGRKGPVVHRLVDGGLWANYPKFVFYDESFRAWAENTHGFDLTPERSRPTIGFVLNGAMTRSAPDVIQVLTRNKEPSEHDLGTLQSRPSTSSWLIAQLFSSRAVRLLLTLSILSLGYASVREQPGILRRAWFIAAKDSTGLVPPIMLAVSVFALLAGIVLYVGLFAILIFGQPIGDVLVPSATGALSVGAGVPPWLGCSPSDYVVVLSTGSLRTTGFRPLTGDLKAAIDHAATVTDSYLATKNLFPEESDIAAASVCQAPRQDDAEPAIIQAAAPVTAKPSSTNGDFMAPAAASVVVVFLAAAAVFALMTEHYIGFVLFLGAAVAFGWFLAKVSSDIHATVAFGRAARSIHGHQRLGWLLCAAGTASLIFGIILTHERHNSLRTTTYEVKIVSAQNASSDSSAGSILGNYRYGFSPALGGATTSHFDDSARLDVGQHVFVEVRRDVGGRVDLRTLGPQDYLLPLFTMSLGVLGLVFGSAYMRRSRRDRLLNDVMASA